MFGIGGVVIDVDALRPSREHLVGFIVTVSFSV